MAHGPVYRHDFSSRDSVDLLLGFGSLGLAFLAIYIGIGGWQRRNVLTAGLGLLIGALLVLSAFSDFYYYLFPRQWEFCIDEEELRWSTPRDNGVLELSRIEEAFVNNTHGQENAPTIEIRTVDGEQTTIPGDHIGSPREVAEFLRDRLGGEKVRYEDQLAPTG